MGQASRSGSIHWLPNDRLKQNTSCRVIKNEYHVTWMISKSTLTMSEVKIEVVPAKMASNPFKRSPIFIQTYLRCLSLHLLAVPASGSFGSTFSLPISLPLILVLQKLRIRIQCRSYRPVSTEMFGKEKCITWMYHDPSLVEIHASPRRKCLLYIF